MRELGLGYSHMKEYSVEKLNADAKLLEIDAGTGQVQRIVIGRNLLK